ncbi:snoal-like polyketide cyclase family [Fusarium albosuccineum]|uniref:Snoal-like polyketide cyclase family n=1 Tax=Fusarium albosuccineum TaxID=1237068 RepID=A0A8H4NQY0_9HYPO|nr:snoal-like polyketide cyclase family [Fusarium albosuccineum]
MLPSTLFASTAVLLALPGISAHYTKTANCVPGKTVTPEKQSINFSNFAQTLYIDKDVPRAFNEHALESYIQHNPLSTSGRQTAIDFLSGAFPK